jgi:hypothetical protein
MQWSEGFDHRSLQQTTGFAFLAGFAGGFAA